MLSYCLKCRRNTESKYLKVVKTKNGRIMPLSKCTVCNSRKSKFKKSLGIRAPLSQTPLLGPILF